MEARVTGLPPGWAGYLVGLLGLIFPFVVSWRRGKIDESALVLSEWRKLYEAHEKRIEGYEGQIARLTDEFDRHREQAKVELEGVSRRLNTRIGLLEEENSKLKQRVAQLEDENAGLKRTLIQNSQSTGVMLGRPGDVATSKANRKEPK